jgi:Tol biopolymer transport system component
VTLILVAATALLAGCGGEDGDRPDGAYELAVDDGSLESPCVSLDGQRAVATRYRDGFDLGPTDLVLVDLELETIDELWADGGHNVTHPGHCWSQPRDEIVFASDSADGRFELFRIAPDGSSDPVRITDRPDLEATQASWTDTGQQVVFTSRPLDDPDGPGTVVAVSIDTGDEVVITPEGSDDSYPTASPASALVVVQSLVDGVHRLVLTSTSGNMREDLTEGDADDTEPAFSWGGDRVAFVAQRDGQDNPDIYTLKIEGCEITRVTEDSAYDRAPAFSASDGHVLFETAEGPDDPTDLWFIPLPGG